MVFQKLVENRKRHVLPLMYYIMLPEDWNESILWEKDMDHRDRINDCI
jgi:hypothetical protein